MRILLINQFGATSGAPTGRILGELANELERRGHNVHLLVTDTFYGNPRRGLRRLIGEGLSHLFIVGRGLRHTKVDAIISLTSPACLAVTAGVLAKFHRAKHYHWAMDLYPDVALRLGELNDGFLVHLFSALMRRSYQEATRVVVLDEDMGDYLRGVYDADSVVIEPFPPEVLWPPHDEKIQTNREWLYSGNFGRAHEIEVLLQVQRKLEDRKIPAELILQGQGPQFLSSRKEANRLGLRQVQWRNPVPMDKLGESLIQSDVLVVTRKADLKGLLLPSKLILAEMSRRPILWIGDTDGKTAQRLSQEGRHGVFSIEDTEAIALWLQDQFAQDCRTSQLVPLITPQARERAVGRWVALLEEKC